MSRRSSRKSGDDSEPEKNFNPRVLLEQIVQLNETVAPSQPDDSPTVTNIKRKASRRSSRRSSGMRALAQTPHALLKNFIDNAPEETPVQVNSSDEVSGQSDTFLAPIPRKISKMVDDDQNVSSEGERGTDDVVRKMPRTRHKAVMQKFSEGLKQQSESPGEDSGSETRQLPSRSKKIRNKITAEDIASGIKLSQEKAAETEKSHNVTEASKTEISLGYLSVNTLNADNIENAIKAVAETPENPARESKREEKDSASSQSESSFKRKRSKLASSEVESLFDLSSEEEEETMQKSKMLRLGSDTGGLVSLEIEEPPEVEKSQISNFVSEAELPDVANTVEVTECMDVSEKVEEVGSDKESGSHVIENKDIVQSLAKDLEPETEKTVEKTAEQTEDSIQSKLDEINFMLLNQSIEMVQAAINKDSKPKTKEAVAYTSVTERIKSPRIADQNSSPTVSKTSNEISSPPGIDMETAEDSTDAHSKRVESNLEAVEAESDSRRGDDSNASKGSDSKEYLAENIDSSSVEVTSATSELQKFAGKESKKPLLASKIEESFESGDPQASDVDIATSGVVESNLSSVSARDSNSSVISHMTSPIVSDTSEVPVQSQETKAEEQEQQSEETPMLTDEKEEEPKHEEPKHEEQRSLVGERVSADEQDELFPSSPKETTSSGHSRSSTPASSEADKNTQRLTLPSSKSAFVEMKSSKSNVVTPSTSGVLKKRPSKGKRSSKKEKPSEQREEKKSYNVIDSVADQSESATNLEVSHLTEDAQIVTKSPYGTMRSLQETAERPAPAEPEAGPSQIKKTAATVPKNADLKSFTIPPKVTSLLINHYSGLKIPTGCLPHLGKITDLFFDNLFDALKCYAKHASRQQIDTSDVELYFKRIDLVNEDKSLNTLIREYLPLEDQRLLIPVARAGNVITGGLSKKPVKPQKKK